MTKVLIVDDEKLARQRLASFLAKRPEKFSLLEAANGITALELLKKEAVHILFLDIQMPEMSGLELLSQLENRNFQVIFQTAYDEFAVRAFEEHACDYLLKPFTLERFHKSLDRALAALGRKSSLEGIEKSLQKRDGFLTKICVKAGNKATLLPLAEVSCFVSLDHYTTVSAGGREHILDLSLNHLESRLDPALFQRLHRNSIVRLASVKSVIGGENMQVELADGQRLPVSRNNRAKLKGFGA